MGYYFKYYNKDYRFRLHASNGESILHSEGYTSAASRDNGINSVRANSQIDSRYEDRGSNSATQPYYFVLKAGNGQIIGTSELYTTKQGRDNGKASVKKNGSTKDERS